MTSLSSTLNGFFQPQQPQPVRYLITWSNGKTTPVVKKRDGYHWVSAGNDAVSSHFDNLKYQVEQRGGRIRRVASK